MRKFYDEKPVWFAVIWILVYCLVMNPILGTYGYESPLMLLALVVFSGAIFAFVKVYHLEEYLGLDRWPKDTKRYLFFLPMWILSLGNLLGGAALNYPLASQIISVLSMILVGFAEEMIFRAFLFRGMLKEGKASVAIIVSALTFGIGHIIRLLSGQGGPETLLQIVFAVSWGFIFTLVYYKSGSLLPCIIAHAIIDVLAQFGVENEVADMIYIVATIAVGIAYSIYLARLKNAEA